MLTREEAEHFDLKARYRLLHEENESKAQHNALLLAEARQFRNSSQRAKPESRRWNPNWPRP